MNAVNLLPVEDRRGASAPSRSGGVVYGVLGVLGVFVVVAAIYGFSARSEDAQLAKVSRLKAESARAQAQIEALTPYVTFSTMAQEREATVGTVAAQRFAWGAALEEIARVVPSSVEMLSLIGSRGEQQAAGTSDSSQPPSPSFEVVACTGSQASVARFMVRLRAIDRVDEAVLTTSATTVNAPSADSSGLPATGGNVGSPPSAAPAAAAAAPEAGGETCPGTGRRTRFTVRVNFTVPASSSASGSSSVPGQGAVPTARQPVAEKTPLAKDMP